MSNIFEIRRFCKYFTHDIKSLTTRYGISLAVLSLVPFITYFMMGTIMYLDHQDQGWSVDSASCAATSLAIAFISLMLSAPVKLYGSLTEKKAGSSWILVPASPLEKSLSMVIVSIVVLPLVVFAGNYVSLALLSLFDHSFTNELHTFLSEPLDFTGSVMYVSGKGIPMLFIGISQSILTFLLGAIVFKKAKPGKTILVCFAISALFLIVFFLIVGNEGFQEDMIDKFFMSISPEKLERAVNLIINFFTVFWYVILLGGIYYRVKTIKQ